MSNSRNGRYNTSNVYVLTNKDGTVDLGGTNTRKQARQNKRNLITGLGLKNDDIRIIQIQTSIVR